MGIPDPGVENSTGMGRPVLQVVVDAAGHHFLGETHHVGLDAKVLVAPHLAGRAGPGLHLIHHKGDGVLATDPLQALEKLGAGVVVPALRLNRLRNDPGNWTTFFGLKVKDISKGRAFI